MDDHDGRLDRILDPSYLVAIRERTLAQLREMRDECDDVECELSYLRRLLQGRVDILTDELLLRAEGKISTAADIVARLPAILADAPSEQARGSRLMRLIVATQMKTVELNVETLFDMPLGDIAILDEAATREILERLNVREREISELRSVLHNRLDTIQAEMARRYRDGEATVENLLQQE